jgi:hypothetical protein
LGISKCWHRIPNWFGENSSMILRRHEEKKAQGLEGIFLNWTGLPDVRELMN